MPLGILLVFLTSIYEISKASVDQHLLMQLIENYNSYSSKAAQVISRFGHKVGQ